MNRKDDSKDPLVIGDRTFSSRLIVGTGKYKDFAETRRAIETCGAEMVTVAVRRVNITDPGQENLLDYLPLDQYTILPNTAGCFTADEAIRTAMLAREAGVGNLVKVEVLGDEKTLFPDVPATLEASEKLVREGFVVLPYITDDPITCRKLEDMGCAAVMPLAAPIGSGLGIRNPYNLRIIVEQANVPVIVDACDGDSERSFFGDASSDESERWSFAPSSGLRPRGDGEHADGLGGEAVHDAEGLPPLRLREVLKGVVRPQVGDAGPEDEVRRPRQARLRSSDSERRASSSARR